MDDSSDAAQETLDLTIVLGSRRGNEHGARWRLRLGIFDVFDRLSSLEMLFVVIGE